MNRSSRDPLLDAAAALAEMEAAEGVEAIDGWHLPRIPVSAGAIILDQHGGLLILKPTYKSGWTIPGGIMEADGESPWDACRREVREETGLNVEAGRLVCVDTRPAKADGQLGLRFLFHCGTLTPQAQAGVRVQREEVSRYRFAMPEQALALLRAPISRRVGVGLAVTGCAYLENGRYIDALT